MSEASDPLLCYTVAYVMLPVTWHVLFVTRLALFVYMCDSFGECSD